MMQGKPVHIEDLVERAIQEINRIADQLPNRQAAQELVDQGALGMLPDREPGSDDRQLLASYIQECASQLAAWAPEASRTFIAIDVWSYDSLLGIPLPSGWVVHGGIWEDASAEAGSGAARGVNLTLTYGPLPPESSTYDGPLHSTGTPQYLSITGGHAYLWPNPGCPGRLFLLISTDTLLENLAAGPPWPGDDGSNRAQTALEYHYRSGSAGQGYFYYYLPDIALQAMVNYAVYRWLAPLGHRAADTYYKAYNDTARSFMRLMAEKYTPRAGRRTLYRHV